MPSIKIHGGPRIQDIIISNWDGNSIPYVQSCDIQINIDGVVTATLVISNVELDLEVLNETQN